MREDIGSGDVTTDAVVAPDAFATGTLISRARGVVAGLPVAALCFRRLDSRVSFEPAVEDGARVKANQVLAKLAGPAAPLLHAERTALNFVQRLSGIATLTAKFVDAVGGQRAKILDTRKTTPCMRALEKYAVRLGGGCNHRLGLYDAILIKDNHLMFRGGGGEGAIRAAVSAARGRAGHLQKIEVEVETLEQVREAIEAGPDAILLDNMAPAVLAEAVRIVRESGTPIALEASGNVNLRNIAKIAASGVDAISIGALTHSAPALDIALELRPA
ncbi:MAG: carboxylating nicotinate-nucleotide diphosphorylase [Candidatus Abyssubacteria bacterium]